MYTCLKLQNLFVIYFLTAVAYKLVSAHPHDEAALLPHRKLRLRVGVADSKRGLQNNPLPADERFVQLQTGNLSRRLHQQKRDDSLHPRHTRAGSVHGVPVHYFNVYITEMPNIFKYIFLTSCRIRGNHTCSRHDHELHTEWRIRCSCLRHRFGRSRSFPRCRVYNYRMRAYVSRHEEPEAGFESEATCCATCL